VHYEVFAVLGILAMEQDIWVLLFGRHYFCDYHLSAETFVCRDIGHLGIAVWMPVVYSPNHDTGINRA